MLKRTFRRRHAQQGMLLLVAIVVLLLMALTAGAMMRSVSSTSLVAGNLAFQQSALTSADRGVEAAVIWLENNNGRNTSTTATTCATGTTVLACDQLARGYIATRAEPSGTQDWPTLWRSLVTAGATAVSTTADAAGNTSSYLIQRLCTSTGDPSVGVCASPSTTTECGQSHTTGMDAVGCPLQVYYRITVRTVGPRNTETFVQSVAAL